MSISQSRINKLMDKNKYPWDLTKNFVGIELEFFCETTRSQLAKEFAKAKLDKQIKVGYDSSIRPGCDQHPVASPRRYDPVTGNEIHPAPCADCLVLQKHEVKVLDTEDNINKTLNKVCKIIKKAGGKVNSSCGLHVHLDMRNRAVMRVYNNLVKSQKLLFKINPTRNNNSFCYRNTSTEWGNSSGHHSAINGYDAFEEHNTIEVRIHKGSVNYQEISNWIKLLINITNTKTYIVKDISTLKACSKVVKLPVIVEKYYKKLVA